MIRYGPAKNRNCRPADYMDILDEILTVGSDGHRPSEVGGAFGQAEEIIKDCGYRYYTVFHGRKPEFIKIE